jgi:glycosyltransferase involved in cell wall biosynthesis
MQATLRSREPQASASNRNALACGSRLHVSFMIDDLSRAGTESQLLALVRGLDRRAFAPSLVLLNGEGEGARSLEPADCPILRLAVTKLLSVKALSAAKRLREFWREHRPDVAQIYFHDSAYFGVPVAKACGVKQVVRVRNNLGYQQTRKHRVLSRLIRPWVSGVLTNSELGRDAIATMDRMPVDRVTVIENGVDLERYCWSPSPLEGEGFGVRGQVVIGCVANLRPIKNIDGLMRAAVRVLQQFPHARFEVAGDGEQRAELENLHAELGLGERFILRGSVSDIPAFLRGVDVAVLPSHSEGMSNSLLEYMAAGKPVAATAVGANPKLLAGGCGVLVPPGDEAALASALCKLLSDPAAQARFATAARSRVEAEYSRGAMLRRFERFYRDLVNRRRESPGG